MSLKSFNPLQQALRDSRPVRDGQHQRTRMCWNCGLDKPTKGGTYPCGNQRSRNPRFKCAECNAKDITK